MTGIWRITPPSPVAGKNFGRPIEAYLAAAVLYFVMCYALSWAVKRLHQKIAIIR